MYCNDIDASRVKRGVWSFLLTHHHMTLFQSRNALLSPTTSTRLWRRIQTANMFCPSTPTLKLCLMPWQTASCCGKPAAPALFCFTGHCFLSLVASVQTVMPVFSSLVAVNWSTCLFPTPSMRGPSIRRSWLLSPHRSDPHTSAVRSEKGFADYFKRCINRRI